MKFVSVVQHTQSEWLGAIEDHLEGRGIRFGYFRPFTAGGKLPELATIGDGLILVGGGPWGAASGGHLLPNLEAEIRLARACLMLGKPVLGFGLGAQILCLAAEGSVVGGPLNFQVLDCRRTTPDALGGLLPAAFPAAVYMRDWPQPPDYAVTLAVDETGRPTVFQIGPNAFGFVGHAGIRRAMAEDLVMEFEEAPAEVAMGLDTLSSVQTAIDDALVSIMAGIVAATGWMDAT